MSFDDLFGAPPAAPRKGNRMSSLPVVQYCPQAARLGAQYGSGRAAAMSRYFHARCAGVPCSDAVSAEELETIDTWHTPTDVTLWNGEVLKYEDAEKELHVGLGFSGEWVDPAAHDAAERLACEGHLDFAWMHTVAKNESFPREHMVVYVADIKKSKWTVSGPDSLQILTYGWAYAKKVGAEAFVPGIWAAQEGEWIWGDWFDMTDLDSLDLWQRIRHAALNTGEANTGPHCRNCYARMHCPEYLFPADAVTLNAFTEGHTPTPTEVADAYLAAQAMEDIAKRIKDNAKEYARRGGEIIAADGRRLVMSERAGRAGFDVKGLKAVHPELAAQFTTRGEPYVVPMWK